MRPPAALPLSFERLSPEESRRRALAFFEAVRTRRSVRAFSDRSPSRARSSSSRPSAPPPPRPRARTSQPWTLRRPSPAPTLKRRDPRRRGGRGARELPRRPHAPRVAWRPSPPSAPTGRSPSWSSRPGSSIVFQHTDGVGRDGIGRATLPTTTSRRASGSPAAFFIAALHHMGLVTLTHTPSPMGIPEPRSSLAPAPRKALHPLPRGLSRRTGPSCPTSGERAWKTCSSGGSDSSTAREAQRESTATALLTLPPRTNRGVSSRDARPRAPRYARP
jgi:iodotyrosine deiodinase